MPTFTISEQQRGLILAALLDAEDKARLERSACRDEQRSAFLAGVLDGLSDARQALDQMPAEPVEGHPTPLHEAPLPELRARLGALVDDMPLDSIERTVGRVHDAYARFLEANEIAKNKKTAAEGQLDDGHGNH